MTDVPVRELYDLARALRVMAARVEQGMPEGEAFMAGAIYGFRASANATTMLAAIGKADEVLIELPPATQFVSDDDNFEARR